MIPDFKTFIGESFWGDVHRRSRGDEERKEDIITWEHLDNLDVPGLYEYLLQNYELDEGYKMVLGENGDGDSTITIPISASGEKIVLESSVVCPEDIFCIGITKGLIKSVPFIENGLLDKVSPVPWGLGRVVTSTDHGEVKNTQAVIFLDKLLEKISDPVIRKKIRKESE